MSKRRVQSILDMAKKKCIEPAPVVKYCYNELTKQDILDADVVYLESSLNIKELLPFDAHNDNTMRTNNLEENIADVVKETNSNEESEMYNVIKYIDTIQYQDYEESLVEENLVELNNPILNNSEINTVEIDEIVTDDVPCKKRKIKTKKQNKVSREESKLKRMAGQEYMGYSRKGKNVSQDQLRN